MSAVARGIDARMTVMLEERRLVVSFGAPVRSASWAIVGGGIRSARHVAWIEVRDEELRPPIDPRELARARARDLDDAVLLMTSRSVATFEDHTVEEAGVIARAVVTVGLGNALRVGDPAGVAGRIGTINMLVHLSSALSDEALLEASSIATEAKTAAVMEAGVASRRTARTATGTGTDCVAVTCSNAGLRRETYAGKHTRVGALVGQVALAAVQRGVERWLVENAR